MSYMNPLVLGLILGAIGMFVTEVNWVAKRYSR